MYAIYGGELNLYNSCSYDHKDGDTCLDKETIKRIETNKGISLKDVGKTYNELNALIDSRDIFSADEFLDALNRFKSIGPTNTDYFSNFHEERVLQQLNKYNPTFYPMPVQLMDFSDDKHTYSIKLRDFIKNLSDDIKSGKIKTIGTVLNTLRSKGDLKKVGHWVAMFFDFREKPYTLEYFNSSGRSADKDVFAWMEKSAAELSKILGTKVIALNVSNIQHQQSGTECGAYSLYFIAGRLEGFSYKKFRSKPIKDAVVTKFRSYIMNPREKIKDKSFLQEYNI